MSLNAKPKQISQNVFTLAIPTATNTDAGSEFDVLNIRDYRYETLHKFLDAGTRYYTVDLNKTINGGFETGDFTGWTQQSASIDAVVFLSGAYSVKLEAVGSPLEGAVSDPYTVDTNVNYKLKIAWKVSAYTAGSYRIELHFYADAAGTIYISSEQPVLETSAGNWTLTTKTIMSSGGDYVFPAGTKSVRVEQTWITTPTGIANMDNVLFYPDIAVNSFSVVDHNLNSANATVSVEYNDDDSEVIDAAWTDSGLTPFTPPDNKVFAKTITEQTVRAWRVKIVTANIAAYAGQVILGPIFTYEKYPRGNFDPQPEKIVAETNKSLAGFPLGTIINYYERMINVNFRLLTPSWVADTFGPEWLHMRQGLPVVWIWDIINHPTEVYYGSIPAKFTRKMPYDPVFRSLNLKLDTIVEEDD